MKADPLKLLTEAARRCSTRQEIAALSDLFDREIAALLLKRRRTLGLTRQQYAERTGLSKDHVVLVEIRGARPDQKDLYAGAKLLNPKDEATAWKLAAELLREAAKRVLEPNKPLAAAA
jgi:transcriptional regulator with XRE-family HTH domain